MQKIWLVKVHVKLGIKPKVKGSKMTCVTIERVTCGTNVHLYDADMETPQGAMCHTMRLAE